MYISEWVNLCLTSINKPYKKPAPTIGLGKSFSVKEKGNARRKPRLTLSSSARITEKEILRQLWKQGVCS